MKHRFLTFLLALCLVLSLCPAAFALTGDAERAADTLATLGLVTGTPNGYALDDTASIEQGAVLLVRLLGESGTAAAPCGWANVPAWAAREVDLCAALGLIRAREYTANAPLSAELWCSMLLRAVGFDEHNGDFAPSDAPAAARRVGLLAEDMSGELTRGTLFETAANALRYSRTGGGETLAGALVAKGGAERAAANALGLLDRSITVREAADLYSGALVCLTLYYDLESIAKGEPSSTASAFFITEDGIAVTNYHSIDDAIYATGSLATGEVVEVEEVLYYNRQFDLALIRMTRTDENRKALPAFRTLELVGPKDARVGDRVYAIGNPLGLGPSVSSGYISAINHTVELSTLPCIVSDASISQGSSGGALLNEYGEVIGVTTGSYSKGNNMYLSVTVEPLFELDLDRLEGITLQECVAKVDAEIKAEQEAAKEAAGKQ